MRRFARAVLRRRRTLLLEMDMTVSELFGKLRALATALRARDSRATARVVGDLLVAWREAVDGGEALPQEVMMSCPCDVNDLDALAGWCEAQAMTHTGAAMTAAFPWPSLLPVLLALVEWLARRKQ